MVMQKISDNETESFEGGRYACTEEELYKKAIALLEKCKIATRPADQENPLTAACVRLTHDAPSALQPVSRQEADKLKC